MGVVPTNRLAKIEFYEARIAPWTTNATAIGLTAASVTALGTATVNARKAYDDHIAAQAAAKAATQAYYDSVREMHKAPGAGADMIQTIKTFAQTTDNPNVYVLAQIPAPQAPSTPPPPGTPFELSVGLLGDGSLQLKWKCSNPAGTTGTIYEVRRALAGGSMQFIGASGVKSFVDDLLPSGAATPVTYQITAVRSTARGNPAQFLVNFGTGGGFTVSAVPNTAFTPSTVDGRAVQKVLPNTNGSLASRH